MQPMRIHQRWMALPWGGLNLAIALVLAAGGAYCVAEYPDDRPSIRVIVPLYLVYVYWVAALLCNRRTAVITRAGVRVVIWPFVIRLPRRVSRAKIQHCYIRNVATYDEGTVLESYYSTGVETLHGEQIEISSPHSSAEDATRVATQAASVLNHLSALSPIEVVQVNQLPRKTDVIWTLVVIGVWLAVMIAAIFAGVAWEENLTRTLRSYAAFCADGTPTWHPLQALILRAFCPDQDPQPGLLAMERRPQLFERR